jgi:hypothetical protein
MHNIVERPIAVNGSGFIICMLHFLMTIGLLMVRNLLVLVAIKEALEAYGVC